MIVYAVEDVGEVGLGINAVQFGRFDDGHGACQGFRAGIGARKEPVFPSNSQFLFILPMSGQFIAFSTGGTRILVPMLRSIDPISAGMGRTWGSNETRALLSWLRPGFWMPRFAG